MMEIQTRHIELAGLETREDDDGFRHLVGVVVPWHGTYTMPNGTTESFARTAFDKSVQERGDRIALYQQHATTDTLPVGNAVEWSNTADGLVADFRMARTARADEVITLAEDGLVSGLSVGFRPIRNRSEKRNDRPHVVRLEAALDHVGFVATPAYDDARVLAVRAFDPDDEQHAPRLARWRHLLA
jgi:hypothetical protein